MFVRCGFCILLWIANNCVATKSTIVEEEDELDDFDDEADSSGTDNEAGKKTTKTKMEKPLSELAFFQLSQQDIYQIAFGHFEALTQSSEIASVAFYQLSLLNGRLA